MKQTRSNSGIDFEKEICEKLNLERCSSSPKIHWIGDGNTNLEKARNHYDDGTSLDIDIEKSKFDKYDDINKNGEKIEIKKYYTIECKKWKLYSEPFIKIASEGAIKDVTRILGDGDETKGKTIYNEIINKSFSNNKTTLMEKISKSNIGIQFIDKFIPPKNLRFRIVVLKGWREYNRVTIQFKIIDESEKTKRSFMDWIKYFS